MINISKKQIQAGKTSLNLKSTKFERDKIIFDNRYKDKLIDSRAFTGGVIIPDNNTGDNAVSDKKNIIQPIILCSFALMGAAVGLATAPLVGIGIAAHDGYTHVDEGNLNGDPFGFLVPLLSNPEANQAHKAVCELTGGNEILAKSAGILGGLPSGIFRGLYQSPIIGAMAGIWTAHKLFPGIFPDSNH